MVARGLRSLCIMVPLLVRCRAPVNLCSCRQLTGLYVFKNKRKRKPRELNGNKKGNEQKGRGQETVMKVK